MSPPTETWPLHPGKRPIIQVAIHAPDQLRPCTALLDPGATKTCVSIALATKANLTKPPLTTGSTRRGNKSVPAPVYEADIELPGALGIIRNWQLLGRDDLPDPDDGFELILGMDLWITCGFFIDGPGRRFGVMR